MTRVVFDTVILVRALIRRRSVWGTLVFEHPQQYKLVVSRPVLAEYMDVLQRPELTTLFHRAADRDFDFILEQLAMADRAEFSDLPRVCRDPNDDKFIATAVAGEATVIVTEDLDLLVLGEHQGISVMAAKEFLDRLLDEPKLK